MMYTMPKNLLSICVNFALATQRFRFVSNLGVEKAQEMIYNIYICLVSADTDPVGHFFT